MTYSFFEAIKKRPDISHEVDDLYKIPHEKHVERIEKIEEILSKLNEQPSHPSTKSAIMKFELMLQVTHEEQYEASSNSNKR